MAHFGGRSGDPDQAAEAPSGPEEGELPDQPQRPPVGPVPPETARDSVITEINTEIDRHTTGGPGARLWSIQAPLVHLIWQQVDRWQEELQEKDLGVTVTSWTTRRADTRQP